MGAWLAFVLPAFGQQAVSDGWRTVETEHFRVHYPVAYETWALAAASRLDDSRERVVAEVGYDPPQKVDVVVTDPIADANAAALPFTSHPRMLLWTTPPESDSVIGHYRQWTDLLELHEDTHLVHMLRPSRNPLANTFFYGAVGIGPITLKAPRWVTEGYATVVEGRLTGAGRPHSDLRAALLRRWAQHGRMPTYGQLASDAENFYGQSMAYLAGSAYLEWLDARAGGGSFQKLWARMTARQERSFEDAFEGVYGDSPQNLYKRFVAELTYDALSLEQERPERAGALVFDLPWTTDLPTLSAEGTRIAATVASRDGAPVLKVWETRIDDEKVAERAEDLAEALEKDPQDVAAVEHAPPPRKKVASLPTIDGAAPIGARFMAGGAQMLFARKVVDGDGVLRRDLFVWNVDDGGVRRVTHRADLWDADPAPDGSWAVAVQVRYGMTSLVRVDLASGAVTDLDVGGLDRVWSVPRISPDGRSVAAILHEGERWRLVVVDVASGGRTELDTTGAAFVSHPAWAPDGASVLASRGEGGFVDVWRFGLDGRSAPLTRSHAAALGAAPTPDGSSFYYLALEPGGMDVRRFELPAAPAPVEVVEAPAEAAPPVEAAPVDAAPVEGEALSRPPDPPPAEPSVGDEDPAAPPVTMEKPDPYVPDASRWPALRLPPEGWPSALQPRPLEPPRPYGVGRMEPSLLVGESVSVDRAFTELGVRVGDVLGRFDALAMFGLDAPIVETTLLEDEAGSKLEPAGAVAVAWRRLPVDVVASGWWLPPAGLDDIDRVGGSLSLEGDHRWRGGALVGEAFGGYQAEDLRAHTRVGGGGRVGVRHTVSRGPAYLGGALTGGGEVAGSDGPDGSGLAWVGRGAATLGGGFDGSGVRGSIAAAFADGPSPWDQVQVGGFGTSFVPDSARMRQVDVPALAHSDVVAAGWISPSAGVALGGGAELFYSWNLWVQPVEPIEPLDLVGVRWQLGSAPQPIARLPGLSVDVGAAWRMDQPFWPGLDGLRAWAQVRYRP